MNFLVSVWAVFSDLAPDRREEREIQLFMTVDIFQLKKTAARKDNRVAQEHSLICMCVK